MKFTVQNENTRIDKYLQDNTDYSRSVIQKMLEDEYILVNDTKVKPSYIIKEDDLITIKDGYIKETDILPEDINLDIVYEDDHLIIINKKTGMVVHPGNGNESGTLVNALMHHSNLSSVNNERPGIVHRIDKDTSGLMLAAKTNKAHNLLTDMFKNKEINREYIALVIGEIKEETGTINAPIGRDAFDRKKMSVTPNNSKEAITHFKVLKRYKGYTLLNLKLETGRTHQIRVHLKYIDFPIYNDPVYTNVNSTSFGQFLHSNKLYFNHPITNEYLEFISDLPKEFNDFLGSLEE